MCTKARLVQAGHTSDWYGMDHSNGPVVASNIRLAANQPAYLEVTIDPAAHGPNGIGPIQRGVTLKTAGGQELTFDLHAQITK